MGSSRSHTRARRRRLSLCLALSLPLPLLSLLFFLPPAHCRTQGADGRTRKLSPFRLPDRDTAGGSLVDRLAERVGEGVGVRSEEDTTAGSLIGTVKSSLRSNLKRTAASPDRDTAGGALDRLAERVGEGVGMRSEVRAEEDTTAGSLVDAVKSSHRSSPTRTAGGVMDGVKSTLRRAAASAADSALTSGERELEDRTAGSVIDTWDRSLRSTAESTAGSKLTSGVRAVLSEVGLRYAKDVMVTQVLNEIIPLTVPDISLDMMTPLGPITVNLSDIVLWNATVADSALLLDEDSGSITLYAGNADANLSASWSFTFDAYLKDHGNATVDMEGLHVVAVGNLTEMEGGLVVGVEEVGCAIDNLQISLHSPYSWIYNWLEARLPNHLRAAVQSQLEWSVLTIVEELNDFLQELPREIPVDCSSDLDVTVPHDPIIKSGALLLDCSGQFEEANATCPEAGSTAALRGHRRFTQSGGVSRYSGRGVLMQPGSVLPTESGKGAPMQPGAGIPGDLGEGIPREPVGGNPRDAGRGTLGQPKAGLSSCPGPERMLTLKVLQEVIDSAILVYYEAGALSFHLRNLPSSFPFQLNTKSWRYLLPSLYRQYPNTDMELSFIAASVPNVTLSPAEGIDAAVAASFFLSVVLDEGQKDVLCIDIALQFSALASLRGNNLTANARLADISVDLRWSTVGSISPVLLEGITRTLTKIVLLPLLNFRLADGFPLPSLPGVAFCNASVVYHRTFLEICTDLEYTGGIFGLPPAAAEA